MTTQKKSKRKGRNKQEVVTVSQTEPEPEAVKTPIDLKRVSVHWPKGLLSYYLLYDGNSHGLSTNVTLTIYFFPLVLFPLFIHSILRPKKTVVLLQQRRRISLSIFITKTGRTSCLSYSQVDMAVSALPKSTNLSTTASAVVALCVSKRAQDLASSVEAWYLNLSIALFVILLWCWQSVIFYFNILYSLFLLWFRSAQKRSRRSCNETPTKARN